MYISTDGKKKTGNNTVAPSWPEAYPIYKNNKLVEISHWYAYKLSSLATPLAPFKHMN